MPALDALTRARRSDPTVDFLATVLDFQPRLRWRLTTRELQQLARLLELWADARASALEPQR